MLTNKGKLVAVLTIILTWLLPGIAVGQSVDTFDPNANSPVYTVVLQADGKILIGGAFTNIGGFTGRFARLTADGTLDTNFNPNVNPNGFPIFALAVQADGKVLVGGQGGVFARLDSNTGLRDTSFTSGSGTNGTVSALVVQADGKILVGGSFGFIGQSSQPRNNIARLNPDGTVDAFNPNVGGSVNTLAVQTDGKILIGGFFVSVGGQPRNFIARLNPDGLLDTTFNPNANQSVDALAVQSDGKILVGGQFTSIGGQPRNYFARLNTDGSLDTSFNPNSNGGINSLAVQADGKALVGGGFTSIGGQPRTRLGRLNADGTTDSSFDINVNNGGAQSSVNALSLQADGKILVGGVFISIGGQLRNRIARLTNTGPALQTLSATSSTITWSRGGTSPEVDRVTFESSTDGVNYTSVGNALRSGTTSDWQLTGLSLTPGNLYLRARGYQMSSSLYGDGSSYEAVQSVVVAPSNTAPTITGEMIVRQQGSLPSSSQIATVHDAEDDENTLSVTATSLMGTGVTVSEISVDGSGNVTAKVEAGCAATNSTFNLHVTDSGSLSADATLTVNVNANTAPTLTYPSNPGTMYGTGLTITPLTGPSDNVSISSVTLQSISPALATGISVNSSGIVTVANNAPADTYTVTIRATDNCGLNTDASFTLGIARVTPVITWGNPADIVYGTALSATQLNAVAGVTGSFSYSPASGTVLNAGNGQTLSVTFNPTDNVNYTAATKTVTINVLKATPVITWNPPTTLSAGTTLSTAQLNATANVPGTFSYTPPAGTVLMVGPLTLTANFTPTDTANYHLVSKNVAVMVVSGFNFVGFFQPVDNAPTVNTVNAGQAIPVKFSLTGNWGLAIFATGYPASQPIACSSGSPTSDIEEVINAGASSLGYDATTDRYTYKWKTDKTWKGTCRKLILKFSDGTTREALFQFK